ncbi:MAG: iron dependent repressor, metal binding and dimerization domain protein [Peptococcaceae bacterium]|jgi:DtxR family Mn-dependent transcriptional regulator|nr:iron dependent repressor, metal binding and dimerization domain protein [Peptococcaceae bacterium]
MNENTNSDFRTVRGYQLANQRQGQLTSALEDYLEMTCRLCLENNYARVGQLSELLNVKPSSASKMISKLAGLGYLKYDRYEIIQLTDSGWEMGQYLLKRHETIESFLALIGSSNPLEEAELVEHSLSSSTVSDLNDLLEFFKLNPALQSSFQEFKKVKNQSNVNSWQ